jgi:hypothetical protein
MHAYCFYEQSNKTVGHITAEEFLDCFEVLSQGIAGRNPRKSAVSIAI